jgi:DnaJ-class molecular chaperone
MTSTKDDPPRPRKGWYDILFGRYTKGPKCKRCHGFGYFRTGPNAATKIPCHNCRGTGREPD